MTILKQDQPRKIDRIIDYFGDRITMLTWPIAVWSPVPVPVAPDRRWPLRRRTA
jgi:hypothetical protein